MLIESDLRAVIANGERIDVEFKSDAREPLNDRDLVEAVACIANGRGGVLLIGVEDDGRVTGARFRHRTYTDARLVEAVVGNLTVPSCPVACSVHTLDGQEVIAIEIPSGLPVTATKDGVYKRRVLDVHG